MAQNTRIGKSLIAVQKELGTEEQCLAFLEALRWPEGVQCLKCGEKKISKFSTKASTRPRKNAKTGEMEEKTVPARHLYQCLTAGCEHQFTATAGTIFNDSHLPLGKWMLAVAIMCNAKKGVSAKQLQRDLETSYKTAWYLAHRIREAMAIGNFNETKMTGTVEADETYVGGKFDKRRKRERWVKTPVFGMVERETGRVHATHLTRPNHWNIGREIRENVEPQSRMMTDESKLYSNLKRLGFEHQIVIHSTKEWVRGECHTQAIDGFWSLLKRGILGSYHQVSIKHLERYITEFSYRFNGRQNQDLFTITVGCLALGAPLPYADLISETPRPPAEPDEVPF